MQLLGPAPPVKVLDAGCGAGSFVTLATQQNYSVLGIDMSDVQIQNARAILKADRLSPDLVRQCSIEDLAAEGVVFGACVILDVLEHLENPVSFLQATRRTLVSPSKLIVSVPARPELYNQRDVMSGHYLRYDPKTLRHHLREGGFVVQHLQYWNFLGWAKSFLNQKVLFREQTDFYEFRYSSSLAARWLNSGLKTYFLQVENRLRPPIGLSLLAVAMPGEARIT